MKYWDEKFYWTYQRGVSWPDDYIGPDSMTRWIINIKRYQDTLSYTSSKVDYCVEQNIYMLPSDMNLKIRSGTVGYNNKILISDEKFSLGKNNEVNLTAPVMKSNKTNSLQGLAQKPHKKQEPHNDEKVALVLALASGFAIWNMFRQ